MGKLTKEEKIALKAKLKAEKEEQIKAKHQKEKEERLLAKEREINHRKMDAFEAENRKKEKIAPAGYQISLQNINKIYPNHVQAVFDFNLDIKDKEFIVFVGPSGCGKSTTLRMIAGLEDITAGDLYINGKYANDLKPIDRDVAMVFQSYALYPNMTVEENLSFGLRMRHVPRAIIDKKVQETAKLLQIDHYLDRKPAALSGGQRQRVALGRAIIRDAKVFLMDEPLSNLDAKLRVQMRSEIVKIHNNIGATTIYVTHDQTEAMTMATRIVVMKDGVIQQIGTPREIYNHPSNTFVACFIGSPAMNIIQTTYDKGTIHFRTGYTLKLSNEEVKMHDDFYKENIVRIENAISKIEKENAELKEDDKERDTILEINASNIAKLKDELAYYKEIEGSKHHDILFGIRPEDIVTTSNSVLLKKKAPEFNITADFNELLGNEYYVHSKIAEEEIIAKISANDEIHSNDDITVTFNLEHIHLFDKRTLKRII